jgi:hypothetical protein
VVNWIEHEHCRGILLYTLIISMEKWRKTVDSTSGFLTARCLKYEGRLTAQLLCLVVGSVAVTVSRTLHYTLQKLECRNYRSHTLQI